MLRSLGARTDGIQTCNCIRRIRIPQLSNREVPGRRGGQRSRGGASPRARILPVQKRRITFDAVHGQGTLHVARQAGQAGTERLIHISGDTERSSRYRPSLCRRDLAHLHQRKSQKFRMLNPRNPRPPYGWWASSSHSRAGSMNPESF